MMLDCGAYFIPGQFQIFRGQLQCFLTQPRYQYVDDIIGGAPYLNWGIEKAPGRGAEGLSLGDLICGVGAIRNSRLPVDILDGKCLGRIQDCGKVYGILSQLYLVKIPIGN